MNSEVRVPSARGGGLRGFAAENGWFLLGLRVAGGLVRRVRDGLIARKLGARGFRMGRAPKLGGLGHMRIGENFAAGDGVWLDAITWFAGKSYEPELRIGRNCNLSDQVHVACTNRVVIGEGFLCGSRVIISDHGHGVYAGEGQSSPLVRPVERVLSNDKSVVIGRNVWVGDGVAILGGAEIGDGAVVGANSVVNGVVEAGSVVVGCPARVVRRWDGVEWVRV